MKVLVKHDEVEDAITVIRRNNEALNLKQLKSTDPVLAEYDDAHLYTELIYRNGIDGAVKKAQQYSYELGEMMSHASQH